MGNMEHPRYKTYLSKFKILPRFIEIKYDIDPNAIIKNSVAVISAPFTSTAILGELKGKPSVFYDPTGLLAQNDPAAHGITILKGKEELASWLDNVNKHLN
jgi:polysaccharide biosynthesis PFTS motif protein